MVKSVKDTHLFLKDDSIVNILCMIKNKYAFYPYNYSEGIGKNYK